MYDTVLFNGFQNVVHLQQAILNKIVSLKAFPHDPPYEISLNSSLVTFNS
jgi:hypothetical protein